VTQTTQLDVLLIDPNQLGKATTANAAFNAFCDTLSKTLTVDASVHGTPYTIPYVSTDGGDKTALQFVMLKITGTIAGAWTGIVPAKNHFFFINNATTGGFATTIKVTGLSGVAVPAGATYLVYNNGTDVTLIAAATQWRTGSGVPSNSLGLDGDLYLNSANGDYYVRTAGAYVKLATLNGTAGGAVSIEYTFDTTTTNSDPGTGKLRLNNATENTATAIYPQVHDDLGSDWTTVLDTLDASSSATKGQFRLYNKSDLSKWILFNITARITHTNYREFTVSVTGSSTTSPFNNGDTVILTFTRTGDLGVGASNAGALDSYACGMLGGL
jgi:hypothetical protein